MPSGRPIIWPSRRICSAWSSSNLRKSGCAKGARIITEKPFGRDLESAKALNATLLSSFRRIVDLSHRPLSRQAAGAESGLFPLRQFAARADLESPPRRERANHDGGEFRRSRAAARFTKRPERSATSCKTICFRCWSNLAMEPPAGIDAESVRDEKVKVLKEIPPLEPVNLVRGQFRGYKNEKGVAPDSTVETFAALRLEVRSWRWQGVPFYIRAGKCLPETCTEVFVQLRKPPAIFSKSAAAAELFSLSAQP